MSQSPYFQALLREHGSHEAALRALGHAPISEAELAEVQGYADLVAETLVELGGAVTANGERIILAVVGLTLGILRGEGRLERLP